MTWRDRVIGGGVGYAVGGPAGAAIGVALAGGEDDGGIDLSDVPFGVHVEADHEDDDAGRRWNLRFLSDVPAESIAVLRVLDDGAQPLMGRAPFVDDGGHFTAMTPIDRKAATIFIPWDAIDYTSPKHLSLEVSVWHEGRGGAAPVGKGVIDAELPRR